MREHYRISTSGSTSENIQIIYESDDFLAVNKPAGLLIHPTENSSEKTLVDWLIQRYPEIKNVGDRPDIRPGIVHRLDRDTSGILIIARTQKFFSYFKRLLKTRQIEKIYLALVWVKILRKGKINKSLGLKSGTIRRTTRGKNLKMIKEAVTLYKPLKYFKKNNEDFTLLELHPKTGRTHQLRVHIASIHHSIIGDKRYGRKRNPFNVNRQFLHAKSAEFNTLKGERIRLEAPLAEDLQNILDSL